MISNLPGSFLGLKAKFVTHFWTAKDSYYVAIALHLKVLLFLLYNDDMVPLRPLFPPIIIYKHTQLIGKIWRWGEEPKGPFPTTAHWTLRTVWGSYLFHELHQTLAPKITNWTTLVQSMYSQTRTSHTQTQLQTCTRTYTHTQTHAHTQEICKHILCAPDIIFWVWLSTLITYVYAVRSLQLLPRLKGPLPVLIEEETWEVCPFRSSGNESGHLVNVAAGFHLDVACVHRNRRYSIASYLTGHQ